jgi:hypothetical protein
VLPGPARDDAPRPWLLPSLMSFGVGALGLGLGVGAGVVTLKNAAALRARCPTGVCAPTVDNTSDVAAANGMGIASTVGFVLGGAGLVTGVVLAAVKPGAKGPAAPGPGATLEIGPGYVGVGGVF